MERCAVAQETTGFCMTNIMTEEQKYIFDVKGWLMLPEVLSPTEAKAVKKHLYAGGSGYTGPAQELLDHPSITGILNEILTLKEPAGDYYNFRIENSTSSIRKCGYVPGDTAVPHHVGPQRAHYGLSVCRRAHLFRLDEGGLGTERG